MFSNFLPFAIAFGASVAALPSSPSVLCVAGQCLQGYSNTTIGAKLASNGAPTPIHLLPGQYTTTTNPQFLHNLLTSSSVSFTPSAGFQNATSSASLPLNLVLSPGLAIYSDKLYSGQASFAGLPSAPSTNSSTPLTASSLFMSSNVWIAVSSSNNNRIVLWDAVPDTSHLPLSSSSPSLSLLDMQSSTCSPACSSSSICSASGTCTCPSGFTGSSCETCASGFFGSSCQACPSGCEKCDDGMTGSGRCLTPTVPNAPATCNCLNGVCGSNGQCQCNPGWTTAGNGTACAKCASDFFLTSTGDCKACQLGCTQCVDGTGACTSCKSGFTQDPNDPTLCNPVQQSTNTGTPCPEGSFANGGQCSVCSPSCKTCNGGTSNDCIICASGSYSSSGSCLTVDGNGVCEGTSLIADNNKHECDTCGAKCTSCKIPNFNAASTINQLQCTGCLPGFVLSQGQCLESCPAGTFVSPQDNLNCIACDSSCGTCTGSSTFCLTCSSTSQLASNGKCVSTCPSSTFSSSSNSSNSGGGSCLTCHPDCASCTGGSFNQCSSCPPSRPVLSNGRCLPTCSRAQYFDATSGQCQACDSGCGSCMGPGASSCLSCTAQGQVLRAGQCVSASCAASAGVVPGLGVCLSDLVLVPSSTNGGPAPLPSITGIASPTAVGRRPLEWWQILLMALGCAFIFLVVVMCWRRKARKGREERTRRWAEGKKLAGGWRGRLIRFRQRMFGGGGGGAKARDVERGDVKAKRLLKRQEEEDGYSRHELDDLDQFIDAYEYSKAPSVRSHATPPLDSRSLRSHPKSKRQQSRTSPTRLSAGHSLYSEMTGKPRQAAEPRQPVKKDLLMSRFSATTYGSGLSGSSGSTSYSMRTRSPVVATEAEAYAMKIRPALAASPPLESGVGWAGSESKNPFRR